MLPLEQQLLVGLSMDESNLTGESILYDPDASSGENDDNSSSDFAENVVNVPETTSDIRGSVDKKRVRFLPDGCLVHVREIPARSPSPELEASASDSSSASDDSSYEDSDSEHDSDDDNLTRESVPSLFYTTTTKPATKTTEVPKLTVPQSARRPAPKQEEPAVIGSEPLPPTPNSSPAPVKHTIKPRTRTRRVRKPSETSQNDNKSFTNVARRKSAKKNTTQEKQLNMRQSSAKISYYQSPAKNVNSHISDKSANGADRISAQRRINSAKSDKRAPVTSGHTTAVSSTLTILPTSSDSRKDMQNGRAIKALQSLSVGSSHTIDELMCPPHQTPLVHFPQILQSNMKQQPTNLPTQHRGYVNRQVTKEYNLKQMYEEHNQTQSTPPAASTTSSNKRSYAWQMANGSIPHTLQNTPSIAQLWNNEHDMFS